MSIRIYVSSDNPLEGKTALVMHLQKLLKRSGVRTVTARHEERGAYYPSKDKDKNIIPADEVFTDKILGDRFFEIDIVELENPPDLDPPKCDCH